MGSTNVDTPFLDTCEEELMGGDAQGQSSGNAAEVPPGTGTASGSDATKVTGCEGTAPCVHPEEVPAAQPSPPTPPVVEVVPSPESSELPTPTQKREFGINSSEELADTATLWRQAMLAASAASMFGAGPTVTAAASYAPTEPKERTNNEGQVAAGLKLDVLAAGLPENVIDSPKCLKCGSEVDAFKTALKNKRAAAPPQFICRICNNVSTMNSRYIGKFDNFDAMTAEEQKDFYLDCQQLAEQAPNGRLQWSAVKQLLLSHLVKSVSRRRSIRLSGDYLPLSVWEKRGFDPEAIRQKGLHLAHPILGDTYRVDLLSVDEEKVWTEMRDTINTAQHKMRKRKLSIEGATPAETPGSATLADSAQAAGSVATPTVPMVIDATEEDEEDDKQLAAMVQSSDSEDCHPVQKRARGRGSGSNAAGVNADAKALKQAAKQAEKEAKKALAEEAKAQKAEVKKLAKLSEKNTSLAQRTVASLVPLLDSAKKVLSAADLTSTPPHFVDELRVAQSAASALVLAGKKWLTKAKKGPNADELGFDVAEAQKATKELKDSQFCLACVRSLPDLIAA